jgi:protein-disulfide isomerase
MHDVLYENQHALDDEYLVEYTRLLGLDKSRFEYDISMHTYAPRVREDFISGVRSGVNGTPTFYINGIRYNGSCDLDPLLETLRRPLEEV